MLAGLLAIFVCAFAAPWVHRVARGATGWLLAAVPAAVFIYFASCVQAVNAGEAFVHVSAWSPELGFEFVLRLDGLALLFALLVTGIGALIAVYAGKYLHGHRQLGRFYGYLFGFMGAMLGLVLADDLITLYLFWELTTITSYLLIGYNHRQEAARSAALQALLVTTVGGFSMLAGFILLSMAGGTMRISELILQGEMLRDHSMYLPILLLILGGAFTKSAIFPFHFWLPSAMEAPTPVSAYLHSSTMVQAGVFLLARLNPALGTTSTWVWMLGVFGGFTMVLGALLIAKSADLKRVLAYATVSVLGLLTMLIGLGTETAIKAMTAYLLAHALYKGALFLVAGIIQHETGTRNAEQMRGLGVQMPVTAIIAVVAGASMAGLPPLLGFFGKEVVLETLSDSQAGLWALIATIVAMAFMAAAAILVALKPFWGMTRRSESNSDDAPTIHEAPLAMLLGPGLLAIAGVAAGLMPNWTGLWVVGPAMESTLGKTLAKSPELWHGLGVAIVYSLLALGLGVMVFAMRTSIRVAWQKLQRLWLLDPERWYQGLLSGMMKGAAMQTRMLQHGYLRHYVLVIVVATVAMVGVALWRRGKWFPITQNADLQLHELAVALITIGATIMVVRSRSLLGAVATLGAVGFAVTLIFVMYSAPDLAMTQFVFETLIVILLVLVVYRLPSLELYSPMLVRVRDGIIAGCFGLMMSLLVLLALDVQEHDVVSRFFVENAKESAHGRNVVNVILVDFRAFDTLGELLVLALGGVGVYTLLRLHPRKRADREHIAEPHGAERIASSSPTISPVGSQPAAASAEYLVRSGTEAQESTTDRPSLPDRRMPTHVTNRNSEKRFKSSQLFQTSVRLFFPLLLTFSLIVLLRGHNVPGGGFIGGLVAAAALAMHAIAHSPETTQRLLRVRRHALIALGLLLALISGLVGLIVGQPFMTGQWVDVTMPMVQTIALGTPLLFDVGVYLLVVGAAVLIIFTAAEE